MLRYFIAIIVILLTVFGPIILAGELMVYIDLNTLIMAIYLPFLYVCILFGFKNTGLAFSEPFKPEPVTEHLLMSKRFFKTLNKVVLISSAVTVFIGVILFLNVWLLESDTIISGILITILPIFHYLAFALIVLIPFMTIIDNKLNKVK